jgi:hypothetical protein
VSSTLEITSLLHDGEGEAAAGSNEISKHVAVNAQLAADLRTPVDVDQTSGQLAQEEIDAESSIVCCASHTSENTSDCVTDSSHHGSLSSGRVKRVLHSEDLRAESSVQDCLEERGFLREKWDYFCFSALQTRKSVRKTTRIKKQASPDRGMETTQPRECQTKTKTKQKTRIRKKSISSIAKTSN